MPIVCDFAEIIGDSPILIGDAPGVAAWTTTFHTKGRHNSTAFLIFNVRGLSAANQDVEVKVNGSVIGRIARYFGLSTGENGQANNNWYTQMISMGGSVLKPASSNEIRIEAVSYTGATQADAFDDFELKNMVCFFHQDTQAITVLGS